MGKTFFTADTHFRQRRTLELSRRPFRDVDEMDIEIIRRWNGVVGPDDIVYHLGDFGDAVLPNGRPRSTSLNGSTIYLIRGNYDTDEVCDVLRQDRRIEILPQPFELATPLTVDGLLKVTLVHEPENALDPRQFYLYGHIHQLQMVKRNGLNVGVDCHQFRPIGWDVVKFYYDAITKHYDQNVFMPLLGGPVCSKCAYWIDGEGCIMLQSPFGCRDFRRK